MDNEDEEEDVSAQGVKDKSERKSLNSTHRPLLDSSQMLNDNEANQPTNIEPTT